MSAPYVEIFHLALLDRKHIDLSSINIHYEGSDLTKWKIIVRFSNLLSMELGEVLYWLDLPWMKYWQRLYIAFQTNGVTEITSHSSRSKYIKFTRNIKWQENR